MNNTMGASLFRDTSQWPVIPPWWLLSSPQAAALINVTSATLHVWRVKGKGPRIIPPMYLKATQGDPVFYQYGALRSWAAQRIGLELGFEEQVLAFFEQVSTSLSNGHGTLQAKMAFFDEQFARNRKRIQRGENPLLISRAQMLEMDSFFSRQPRWLVKKMHCC
ncbi:hypothetical protein [uncultured Roseovarius sp.]|uniref:hypothetical protein n=1 Tax=uncultured Roseovarius sp. TaxID=293344 RepID=UPI002597751F|nr:hypothetical protein [uncultured Roseovarius sp.]